MNDKLIVGLVGETGSGKGTIAEYLAHVYGAEVTRFSDPMKKALSLFFDRPSKADQAWLYLAFKERFGETVLHRAVRRHIAASAEALIVVDGLRMPSDADFMRSFARHVIIYITAPQHLRWERVTGRGEKSDDAQPFAIFQQFEATAETERHVPDIGRSADHRIDNTGTEEELLAAIDAIMAQHGCTKSV